LDWIFHHQCSRVPMRWSSESGKCRRRHLSSRVLDGPRRHRLEADRLTVCERQNASVAEDEEPEFERRWLAMKFLVVDLGISCCLFAPVSFLSVAVVSKLLLSFAVWGNLLTIPRAAWGHPEGAGGWLRHRIMYTAKLALMAKLGQVAKKLRFFRRPEGEWTCRRYAGRYVSGRTRTWLKTKNPDFEGRWLSTCFLDYSSSPLSLIYTSDDSGGSYLRLVRLAHPCGGKRSAIQRRPAGKAVRRHQCERLRAQLRCAEHLPARRTWPSQPQRQTQERACN